MSKRIVRIAPLQLGKVAAVFYGIFSIPFALIMAVAAALSPAKNSMPIVISIGLPVVYVIFGFIFMTLGAWLYNVVAKWTGGIEYESEETS
jgi:hypothetical protein